MKRKIFITLLFLLSFVTASFAQTDGQKAQAQFKYVTALPATCAPNSSLIYAVIGASPFRYYVCGAIPNTFTELTNTASGTTPGGADTSIQYNDVGTLAGDANFTWNKTSRTATLTGGTVTLNLTGVSDATATIYGAGARLGNSGGTIYPFVGGGQNTGPGTRWSDGTNMSGLYISNGLVWQGHNSTHDPFKIRKGTSGTSDGAMIFEFRPSSAYFQIYPFDTTAGSTTPIKFTELAANGTNFTAIKAADAITNDATIVLPINNAPSTNDVLTVTGVSGGVVTTAWQAAAGGTTINTTDGVVPYRSNSTTFVDSPIAVSSGAMTVTPTVTTGTGINNVFNSLTTGKGSDFNSSSITTGSIVNITQTSTVGDSSAALNIAVSGANSTSAKIIKGGKISVTNTNATSGFNYALELTASGATGSIGSGENRALNITAGQSVFPDTDALRPAITFSTNKATGIYLAGSQVLGFTSNASNSMVLNGFDLVVQNNGSLGITSATGTTADVILDRVGAAHWKYGSNTDAASPVAQTQSVQNVVAGTSNTAGSTWTRQASLGTSQGAPGRHHFTGGAMIAASGTTQQTAIDREVFGATKVLTNNTNTALVNGTIASNTAVAYKISYGVEVFDGTDVQVEEGEIVCHATNKAAAIANNTCVKFGNQQAATSGTLTVTWTITAASPAVVTLNANSSLTPSTGYPRVTYSIRNLTQQAIAVQ